MSKNKQEKKKVTNLEVGTIGSSTNKQNQSNMQKNQQQYTNEFAQGTGSFAKQAYQAMSEDAKARTNASKQQYKTQQDIEFAQGTGQMGKEARLNSQEAAKQIKKQSNQNQNNQ
ncbi:MAG: hypothetical protein GX490_07880 [Bacilli bacterium]|nr:hypothetical protein [Bacilli bacterium]